MATFCLGVSSTLWSLQTLTWLLRLAYYHTASDAGNKRLALKKTQVIPLGVKTSGERVFELRIRLGQRIKVRPGQYVYLTEPRAHNYVGVFQAHPYMIAWSEQNDISSLDTDSSSWISVLVQRRRGFSALDGRENLDIILDGPYGSTAPLHRFDKVLFIASGVGIAAHLSYIQQLLLAHMQRTVQIRRLTLFWVVDDQGE